MTFVDKFTSQASSINLAARIIKEKALIYGLWVNQPGDKKAYFIIEVDRPKHAEFKRLIASPESLNFAEFGSLLYKSWQEPDEQTKENFRKKYGMYNE